MFETNCGERGQNQVLTQERMNQLEMKGQTKIERNPKTNLKSTQELLALHDEINNRGDVIMNKVHEITQSFPIE